MCLSTLSLSLPSLTDRPRLDGGGGGEKGEGAGGGGAVSLSELLKQLEAQRKSIPSPTPYTLRPYTLTLVLQQTSMYPKP